MKPIHIVSAFTGDQALGNLAAVCFPSGEESDAWRQHTAAMLGLSETAYLTPRGEEWSLRWFTPTVEVDLCGHATLAAAHVLWETGRLDRAREARFQTRSGLLIARWSDEGIVLDFPATHPTECDPPEGLAEALGIVPVWTGRTPFDLLVEVDSAKKVRGLTPNLRALAAIPARGVIVTARGEGEIDFVSRFFAPASGIDEDPVTGSAHCALAPFWGARLGKTEMTARQLSSRGGALTVRLLGERVELIGKAQTAVRGELV